MELISLFVHSPQSMLPVQECDFKGTHVDCYESRHPNECETRRRAMDSSDPTQENYDRWIRRSSCTQKWIRRWCLGLFHFTELCHVLQHGLLPQFPGGTFKESRSRPRKYAPSISIQFLFNSIPPVSLNSIRISN